MTKRRRSKCTDEMRDEYDFTGAERGRLARKYGGGLTLYVVDSSLAVRGMLARRFGGRFGVLLDADRADVFEDSATVNAVLRPIADLVRADRVRRGRKTRPPRAR